MLFLQAAGSDFGKAHDLVAAVTEAMRTPHDEQSPANGRALNACMANGFASRRRGVDPERIAARVGGAGWENPESLLLALAAHATIASPFTDLDTAWVVSAAARIGDEDLLIEMAGVVFAFNLINRVANARRVQLEYRFVRGMWPIRGWVERRLASLTGLVYDLSFKHRARHSPQELLDRLHRLFKRLGAPAVPDVFQWLSQSPVVLEGVIEMLDVNVTNAGVRLELLKEAAAIAVSSRAMPGSALLRAVDQWLPQESLNDSRTFCASAASSGAFSDSSLVSACRQYSWQVANAHTISEEEIRAMSMLGLNDAERLDLTLATAVFAALAIIEPISAAMASKTGRRCSEVAAGGADQVQSALNEGLAV